MNLLEIRLGARDYPGIDIKTQKGSNKLKLDPATYRGLGFDGVRFIGAGVGKTRVVPSTSSTDTDSGHAVVVGLEAGHVEFESMSLHVGPQKAMHLGGPTRGEYAEPTPDTPLEVVVKDFEVIADQRTDGDRSFWGIFHYQTDLILEDGEFHCAELAEHAAYGHGHGKNGQRRTRVHFRSSGAEGDKNRADPSEINATPGSTILIDQCSFANWNQPWSYRGGAGVVCQGTGANIVLKDTVFHGGADAQHSRCFMVDDNGDKGFWSSENGTLNSGSANGHIILDGVGMSGIGPPWFSDQARVGTIATTAFGDIARSFTMSNSGLYGPGMLLKVQGVPQVEVSGCNTEAIADQARAFNIDPSVEAQIALSMQDLVPVSAGASLQSQGA